MAYVISMLTQKGGAGKSTISVHLSACLAVLHPHLSVAVGDADPQASATAWIKRGNGAAGITVHPVAVDGEGKLLKNEIEAIGADIVVLDLPPVLESIALRSALRSDLILIPVLPSIIDLSATKGAVAVAQEAIEFAPNKKFLLIPNRVQNNTAIGRELRSVLEQWGPVSHATICQRIALSESAAHGLGISQFAPESPAAAEIRQLAEEVSEILGI